MDFLIEEFLRDGLGLERVADVFGWTLAAAFVINVALAVRIVWSKAARPNAALAWLATLFAFPILGCVLYIVIGENRIGAVRRRRHARIMRAVEQVEGGWKDPRVLGSSMSTVDTQMAHLGESSGAPQVLNGNLVQLTGDPAEQVRWITSDIDAAVRTADALFYIFETDETGRAVADALALRNSLLPVTKLTPATGWVIWTKGAPATGRSAMTLTEASLVSPLLSVTKARMTYSPVVGTR
jgi:hypothetical protein